LAADDFDDRAVPPPDKLKLWMELRELRLSNIVRVAPGSR
jgi:hypothetical protein